MLKYLFISICIILLKIELYSQEINYDSIRFVGMVLRDTTFIRDILDDSLVYIHSNGLKESKADFIHSIASKKIVYEKFEFLKRRRMAKTNTKLLFSGEVAVKGLFDQQPFYVKLAFTSAYRKNQRYCRLIYWQSTRLKE